MLAATWISHYPPNLKLEGDPPIMNRILKNARVFDLLPIALGLAFYLATANLALGQAQSSTTPSARPSEAARPAKRPIPPAQYIPAHDYDQQNIKLDLRFDWEREQAFGTATITLSPLVRDLSRVDLDAAYMTISAATLPSGTQLKYEYNPSTAKLAVSLDHPYQPNEQVTIVIAYHTNQPPPDRRTGFGGGGINFIKPTASDPTRPRQIWTQGEAESNHLWFPCFDHPNDFTTTEIIATVEPPFTVISNGALVKVKDNKDDTRTFDWRIDQPHATYLTSLIVGEFAPVEDRYAGIPITTYVYQSQVEEGKVTAARLAEMVKFFSEKTGVKYPYAKYAQTTVRDFGGGMENISATTQTDNMIHDKRTELDQTSDSLQSHELAHQWFGDYVTCRTWSDIWLNEGFATYFQAMWDEHSLGRADFLYIDVKGNQDQYYRAWGQGNRRPIVTRNYANPDAVFDTYAYPRGGAVLHMLRNVLGEENWWRSINHYLTKYAHQPVETEQFRIAIEETTGQPMDWFFDEWVYKMGHPKFRVSQAYDARDQSLTLVVRQEQKPDPESQYPQVMFFQTPVDVEIGTAKGNRVERIQIAAKEEQSFKFTVDSEPLLVNFDYGDMLIKELDFQKTTGQLLYQLAHDDDVLARIWALQQLRSRMNDDKYSSDRTSILSAINEALTKDPFWGTRVEAAVAMSGVSEAKDALYSATRDNKARVRERAIISLAATKDVNLAHVYQKLLEDPSYAVIRAAALALGQTKSPEAFESLTKLINTNSWRDTIRAAALNGLAALQDPRALDLGFKYAASGNQPAVRSAAVNLVGAVGKDDPRTFSVLSEIARNSFRNRNLALFSAAAEALVALGDQRGLALFEEIHQTSSDNPRLSQMISGLESRLRSAARHGNSRPGPQ